ncbi:MULTISPECIES: DUF397 domain-containing protein [Nocardiopsis]|uniref:DUF397 domain-containing protein n=1 Tax=Nocardiopsis dassonvillei (strain ATCC 23218 / DSM 43111 / CIP 107115 / JCM 7437 / KCTC 9190 / NBRC 14626 / NCTC 10488 / NRRL B-5397 / IMRU 509) TaxID=446468 RepID=D7AXU4_NOCDD|nr:MULTISPECIES: DUF397 domain-containing protein [Nocardiopsis]ADH67998.1 protein of unknown function DUF397 [Nocardiopsis dassonvillei subsp. dassonvillei DSM 43111]NKY79528.1 DUF397 domain-containing protein [Nocardiopsis dassonvillei]VEI88497.1 Domain of uncharacterised function (DUF397) [Nocardiopsis dassonvillei]
MANRKGEWHKSKYSSGGQNCVEARESAEGADIRDTQNRELGHLTVSALEWTAVLAVTKG